MSSLNLAAMSVVLAILAFFLSKAGGWQRPEMRRLAHLLGRAKVRQRRERGTLARLDHHLVRAGLLAEGDRRLREVGVPLRLSEALAALVGGVALGASVGAILAGPLGALAAVMAVPSLAWWSLSALLEVRTRRLERQLPLALDMLVGQLRAHRSVAEAFLELSRRLPPPLGVELGRVVEEIRFGASLERSLDALRRRIPSRPLNTAVTAILVAARTGGNLAEFLSRQSATVRTQVAFLQEVRALTAHARITALVLTMLPVGVAAGLYAVQPTFFAPLFGTHEGRLLLGLAVAMELAGWQVIRSMIRSAIW